MNITDESASIIKELLTDVTSAHCDPESPDHNYCEVNPCQWCEDARKVLEDLNESLIR